MSEPDFIKAPSGRVFAVLPPTLNPPSDPEGDWWLDLEEIDIDPDPEPTDEGLLLRLDLMGELELMRLNHRLIHRRYFGLGALAAPAHWVHYLLTRTRFNHRLRLLGHRPIPRSFKPPTPPGYC